MILNVLNVNNFFKFMMVFEKIEINYRENTKFLTNVFFNSVHFDNKLDVPKIIINEHNLTLFFI